MNINRDEAFPPKWLSKDNVDELGVSAMDSIGITSVGYEPVGEAREPKIVLRFREIPQGLICGGVSYFDMLTDVCGEGSDTWPGKRVSVVRNPKYPGKGQPGLLIKPPRTPDDGDVPF